MQPCVVTQTMAALAWTCVAQAGGSSLDARVFRALHAPYERFKFIYPGGSRKRSKAADSSFSRAASEAPSDTGSMDWAGSLQAGEEEELLPNGKEPTPAPPSLDEHIPSVEVGF